MCIPVSKSCELAQAEPVASSAAGSNPRRAMPKAGSSGGIGIGSLKASEMVCMICDQICKRGKKRWGLCCAKDVEAAQNNASRQGPDQKQAFEDAKNDASKFKEMVAEFRLKCPSTGQGSRRPCFDFVQYMKTQSQGHKLQDGVKGEYMAFAEFVSWHKEKKQMDPVEARSSD